MGIRGEGDDDDDDDDDDGDNKFVLPRRRVFMRAGSSSFTLLSLLLTFLLRALGAAIYDGGWGESVCISTVLHYSRYHSIRRGLGQR